jgi:hypothetical protein
MDIKTEFTLKDLLELEKDSSLLGYSCPKTGLPIWPLLRIQVFRIIMSSTLYNGSPLINLKRKRNLSKLIKPYINSIMHNIFQKPTKNVDIMFFSTGLGNLYTRDTLDDRLIGEFSRMFSNNSTVYQNKLKEKLFETYSFGPVKYRVPNDLYCKLRSYIVRKSTHRIQAKKFIKDIECLASRDLRYKFKAVELEYLENFLVIQLAKLPIYFDKYVNFFAKKGVKILFLEDACFGGELVAIIAAAKQNGIKVVEYQHGVIAKGHDGYNISTTLAESDQYKHILPDYLLTYGSWWSKQSNLPIPKVKIGNPFRELSLKKMVNKPHKRKQILILGDGYETSLYLDLSQKVLELVALEDVDVLFRPHPIEKANVTDEILPSGVILDLCPDIYESFTNSILVISELSTGLFEAIGIADNILMWETKKARFMFPDILFDTFDSYDELKIYIDKIFNAHTAKSNVNLPEYWEANWEDNLFQFIEMLISNKNSEGENI